MKRSSVCRMVVTELGSTALVVSAGSAAVQQPVEHIADMIYPLAHQFCGSIDSDRIDFAGAGQACAMSILSRYARLEQDFDAGEDSKEQSRAWIC